MKNLIIVVVLAFLVSNCGDNSVEHKTTTTTPKAEQKVETPAVQGEASQVQKEVKQITPVTKTNNAQQVPLQKKEGSISGIFKYMADAAIFKDCKSQEKMSVAMEGGYLNLEKLYLASVEGGTPVLITLEGAVQSRKAMEGNKTEKVLVITKILSFSKRQDCPE